MEADGPVGSWDGVTPCLQDVPQLERYLKDNNNNNTLWVTKE